MRPNNCAITCLLAVVSLLAISRPGFAADIGTVFTYQGRLVHDGQPANGIFDFNITLMDAASGGNQIGPTSIHNDVQIVDGLITLPLDFGPDAFTNDARWLQVYVRPGDTIQFYTPLLPRQPITPTPYSLRLALPYSAQSSATDALIALDQSGTGPALALAAGAGNAVTATADGGGKAVYAQTSGGGISIHGYNLGAAGEAGYFRSESTLNPSPSVHVQNNGIGAGVRATARLGTAGLFEVTNGSSTGRAVDAVTAGVGDAARVTISNALSAANALWTRTTGQGRAALIEISNTTSTATALEVRTDGTGRAAKFVGDVQVLGDLEADGTIFAAYGNTMNRAAPIAYGRVGHSQSPGGSNNVSYEVLATDNSYNTWRVTIAGESAPTTWVIVADVTYSDPENPTRQYTVRTSRPDAQGRFKIHLQCTSNCDTFSAQTYGVSFVVYRP